MRFDLDDDQRAIQDTVRDLARSRYDAASAATLDRRDTFWPELAATGWTQLAVPRRFGGDTGGVLELALLVEELAYALAPGAFFSHACAGVLLAAAGESDLVGGERRCAFGARSGASALVLEPEGAALIVVADAAGGALTGSAPGSSPATTLDLTRRFARIATLENERALHGEVVAAIDCVEVLIAAELVGLAQHAMELAVEHAQQRQQFGRPIGAYQAVAHRCADMLIGVESARSATLAAAWTADHEPERLPFAASVAKAAAAQVAWSVTTSALQVHGGIGFTWEHPIHLFLRRAAVSARMLGSASHHLDRVAARPGPTAPPRGRGDGLRCPACALTRPHAAKTGGLGVPM